MNAKKRATHQLCFAHRSNIRLFFRKPAATLVLLSAGLCAHGEAQTKIGTWVQVFEAAPAAYEVPVPVPAVLVQADPSLADSSTIHGTLRYRFSISLGGELVRVRLSNESGKRPLVVRSASLAVAADGLNAVAGSMRSLTFSGNTSISIPAGAPVLSDPIKFPARALSELVASVYVDQPLTSEPWAQAVQAVTVDDQVMAPTFTGWKVAHLRPLVSGVLVLSPFSVPVVVGFGDSITDGTRAKATDPHGWVYELSKRLAAGHVPTAVVSAGISGNRLLEDGWGSSALARADRDVFCVPGVTHVILLEGINDIAMSGKTLLSEQPLLKVEDLLSGYKQIAARAHALGLKVYIGTLTPFSGWNSFSMEKEQMRVATNEWIRSNYDFDGVIDFDLALRDPASLAHINAQFDSGDHLHPNQYGYKRMSEVIPLNFLK